MSCIEGKGGLKEIHCMAKNAALFVDLLWNILCEFTHKTTYIKKLYKNCRKKDVTICTHHSSSYILKMVYYLGSLFLEFNSNIKAADSTSEQSLKFGDL